jgi:hypothetical protein
MDPKTVTRAELDAVRIRRAELRESMEALDKALTTPPAGRAVLWGGAVHTALGEIADDFSEHIEVTEGPDGLHQAILSGDLRLANQVEALTSEHEQLAESIARLVVDTLPPVADDDVTAITAAGMQLLDQLVKHRQRGADLIYEAYDTDIGGGD